MQILESIPWYGWVAIIAIVSGCAVQITRRAHEHEERMAKIERGLDPDRRA